MSVSHRGDAIQNHPSSRLCRFATSDLSATRTPSNHFNIPPGFCIRKTMWLARPADICTATATMSIPRRHRVRLYLLLLAIDAQPQSQRSYRASILTQPGCMCSQPKWKCLGRFPATIRSSLKLHIYNRFWRPSLIVVSSCKISYKSRTFPTSTNQLTDMLLLRQPLTITESNHSMFEATCVSVGSESHRS